MYRQQNGSPTKERLFITIFDEGWGDENISNGLGSWDITGVDDIFGAPAYEPIYAYIGSEEYLFSREAAYITANNITSAPSSTGWGELGNPLGYPIFTAGIQMIRVLTGHLQ